MFHHDRTPGHDSERAATIYLHSSRERQRALADAAAEAACGELAEAKARKASEPSGTQMPPPVTCDRRRARMSAASVRCCRISAIRRSPPLTRSSVAAKGLHASPGGQRTLPARITSGPAMLLQRSCRLMPDSAALSGCFCEGCCSQPRTDAITTTDGFDHFLSLDSSHIRTLRWSRSSMPRWCSWPACTERTLPRGTLRK